MRIGEAIGLDRENVDLRAGVLHIPLTKFRKHRRLPLHESTCAALRDYAQVRDELCPHPKAPTFFVSIHGTRLLDVTVHHVFRKLLIEIGLEPQPDGTGPKVHGLRHTFAVATVRDWHREGADPTGKLSLLSAYVAMPIRPTPTGICKPAPNCWGWPQSAGAVAGAAAMTTFAPTIEAYFTERLITQRRPPHPRRLPRQPRMLLVFAQDRTGKAPSQLDVSDVDATLVGDFLTHLEHDRRNSARTRNTRLAAIHSLFRYAAYRHPEHAQMIQRVLAIPSKRYDKRELDYLEVAEVDALLAATDRSTWIGRRDHMLLVLAVQTGLRVSDYHLTIADLELGPGAHVRCRGKGRKDRATPMTKPTVALLRQWMKERSGGPSDPVFPTSRGQGLSVDAVQWLVAKYSRIAALTKPSLTAKIVSPHVLRHTCAMNLLKAGVDSAVIALWLGHESSQTTQIYIHASMALKEKALARTAPLNTKRGRYTPPDTLLAFLITL